MQLDARSLIVASILVTMVLSLLDIVIWRTRNTFPGFGRWTIAHVLVTPGLLLFSFRTILPDFVTIVVANTISLTTAVLVLEAAREFRGLKPRVWQAWAGAGVSILGLIFFRYVVNNLNIRALIAST